MNRMAQQNSLPPQDHRNDEIGASPDRLFPEQEETMNSGGVSSSTRKRRAEGSVENMIRINKKGKT
jgi:hypothetical protein